MKILDEASYLRDVNQGHSKNAGFLVDTSNNFYIFEENESERYEKVLKDYKKDPENFNFTTLGAAPESSQIIKELMEPDGDKKLTDALDKLNSDSRITLKDVKVLLSDIYSKV